MKLQKDFNNNIIPIINFIITNIPTNLTPLEEVRYIYLKFGKIFSYDYRIMKDFEVSQKDIDYASTNISNYQTCIQISEMLALVLNNINPDTKARTIIRPMEGRDYLKDHVAVEVTFKDGLKILLDLTLDLYLIQSGMQTKEFGYSNNILGEYDIISLRECKEMDKKIGYIKEEYTNEKISKLKEELDNKDYPNMSEKEILEYKLEQIKETLSKKFDGCYESMLYIKYLLLNILNEKELSSLKQYNLSYGNIVDLYMLNIFMFNNYDLIYTYTNEFGLEESDYSKVKDLLNSGWITNSTTLEETITKKLN